MRCFLVKAPKLWQSFELPDGSTIEFKSGETTKASPEQWQYLRFLPSIVNLIQTGSIVEIEGEIPPDSLGDLSLESIVEALANCTDVDYLESYLIHAQTPFVQEAIVRRSNALIDRLTSILKTMPKTNWDNFNPSSASASEMKAAIGNCENIATLTAWLGQVSRRHQGVINAKIRQLETSTLPEVV